MSSPSDDATWTRSITPSVNGFWYCPPSLDPSMCKTPRKSSSLSGVISWVVYSNRFWLLRWV
eukprot:3033208-Rhodomonas_salina.1